jgi:hypothetical protein
VEGLGLGVQDAVSGSKSVLAFDMFLFGVERLGRLGFGVERLGFGQLRFVLSG